jgi:hypothetical protein
VENLVLKKKFFIEITLEKINIYFTKFINLETLEVGDEKENSL